MSESFIFSCVAFYDASAGSFLPKVTYPYNGPNLDKLQQSIGVLLKKIQAQDHKRTIQAEQIGLKFHYEVCQNGQMCILVVEKREAPLRVGS